MRLGVVTLFPEMFAALTEFGISSRAVRSGLVTLDFWNPRDFTQDVHRTVDDKPFGGGPGMLMKTGPVVGAIRAARQSVARAAAEPRVVYLSPQGRPMCQRDVKLLAQEPGMVLLCGRYQGVDARVVETEVDMEISLGDFVISGGELAAMAMIDALIRLQPGALGDENSALEDSFADGLLHCPEYTRPQEVAGQRVPEILLSGDHAAIRRWRLKHSLGATWLKRPDLLQDRELTREEEDLLGQFKNEYQGDGSAVDTDPTNEFRSQ